MKTFSISEVEELTGVKQHVLRYWEEAIPGFSVQKNVGGRRTYTQNDVEMILRLKHLIMEKKFTTEGARLQLIEDAQIKSQNIEVVQKIHEARSELTDLYLYVKGLRERNQK
ncbi:MAG: MerR family transcriptional regulator [Treponema sp.]|nr:MerR family transcriptional regulator [Treponema sp.]